jgi:putative flippase GtrA
MKRGLRERLLAALAWALRLRYARFGLVGAAGTVVNMLVLALAQEWVFRAIQPDRARLYVSLAAAILVATIHNFSWNRLWTWADRQQQAASRGEAMPWGSQFLRYALASWLGIGLQYALTLWLAHAMHYLLANLLAIVIASISNFIANDRWTFRHRSAE